SRTISGWPGSRRSSASWRTSSTSVQIPRPAACSTPSGARWATDDGAYACETPRAAAVSRRAACSWSLTSVPPKPRKPPSFEALATRRATSWSHSLKPAESPPAFPSTTVATAFSCSRAYARACSGDLPWISVGFTFSMFSRAVRSVTTASTRGLAAPFAFVSATSLPTANISSSTPIGPLGLAATTTRLLINGLLSTCVHSSGVKSWFPAMSYLRGNCSVFVSPIEVVMRLDEAHRARRRAHDDGIRHGAAANVAHAGEVVSGRHAGGGTHHHAGRELFDRVLALQVEEPERAAQARLELVARPEPRLHLAPPPAAP